jgi:Icc-related predicted phosphoesterase
VLDEAEWITNAEGQVLALAPGLQMISTGYGNPTPWKCPRDVSEDELGARIEQMAGDLDNSCRAVFNLHVPPYGSGLDRCPKLDTSVNPPKPITGAEIAAGSTAVADALRRYEPILSLHGHIHEAAGIREIGHTVAINPGSEYGEGVLRTAVIDIEDGRVMPQLLSA